MTFKLWVLLGVLIVGALSWALWCGWDWWNWVVTGPNGRESGSTTLRNLGLVIGGVIAIGLAIWRSRVADRQAKTAQRQAEIAEGGLRNDRYQKSAEMLGSEVPSVRLGGIYALQRLAEEDPEQYHVQIMRLLCAFVRHPPKNEYEKAKTLREDVHAIMEAIAIRSDVGIKLEEEMPNLYGADLRYARFRDGCLRRLNFSHANLSGADLSGADLSGSWFIKADLSGANLSGADLSNSWFTQADLSEADLSGTDLSNAVLKGTNVSGTKFFVDQLSTLGLGETEGLTQVRLNMACADPNNLPKLGGLLDAQTKKELSWRGSPCGDNG